LQSAAGLLAVSAAAAPQPGKRPLSKRLSIMIGGYFGRNVPLEEKLKKLASINYPAVEGVTWKGQDLAAIKAQIEAAHLELAQIGGSVPACSSIWPPPSTPPESWEPRHSWC
jgi:hypothetical protein